MEKEDKRWIKRANKSEAGLVRTGKWNPKLRWIEDIKMNQRVGEKAMAQKYTKQRQMKREEKGRVSNDGHQKIDKEVSFSHIRVSLKCIFPLITKRVKVERNKEDKINKEEIRIQVEFLDAVNVIPILLFFYPKLIVTLLVKTWLTMSDLS